MRGDWHPCTTGKGNGHGKHEPAFSAWATLAGFGSSGTLGRPYIANAQAKTATVWVNQGFVPQEDAAFKKVAADYMKESGNKLDYSIMPFMAQNQKTISALTSGDVPDLIFMDAPATILPQNAWDDKIVDVSDVVAPYESQLTETAKLCSTFFNKTTKSAATICVRSSRPASRSTSGAVWSKRPATSCRTRRKPGMHSGTSSSRCRKRCVRKGMRKFYALGLQITTVGPNDGNGLFQAFMIANGGQDIVTPDGKLHTDDPKIREAAIKSCACHDERLQGRASCHRRR